MVCSYSVELQGERSYSPAIIRETRASLAGASQIFLGRPFRPGIEPLF